MSLVNRLFKNVKGSFLYSKVAESLLRDIEKLISSKENGFELVVIVERSLPFHLLFTRNSQRRAKELFSLHSVWDTQNNTGVLLYLLLSEHAIEIVYDRGLKEKISEGEWTYLCSELSNMIRSERNWNDTIYELVTACLIGISSKLQSPNSNITVDKTTTNELDNKPIVL
jgi:uncharacterized membrane protein